jgi:hypothetical protein
MNLIQKPLLRLEDFPQDQQSWLSLLFGQLNPFFSSVFQILNNNVDYSTNIPSVTNTYSIHSFQTFSMKWKFPGYTPTILNISAAYNVDTQEPTILMAAWSYDPSKSLITISNMLEVTESGNTPLTGKYTFNVRVSV